METKLFWIGISSGIYAWTLRRWLGAKQHQSLNVKRLIIAFLHGMFMFGAGFLFGGLTNSFSSQDAPEGRWMLICGFIGLALGSIWGYLHAADEESKITKLLRWDLEWAETGFSAIVMASAIMFFVVQAFRIPSGSMRTTLLEKDHLFVNKFVYGLKIPLTDIRILPLRKVTKGDIIVFRYPAESKENFHYGKDFIKRVIGLPGDEISIRDKVLYINGVRQFEPYANHIDNTTYPPNQFLTAQEFQAHWQNRSLAQVPSELIRDNFGPVKVPPDHYFVMGDNRDSSFDSRFWGPMPRSYLKGKAWVVYWPLKRIKVIK